MLNKMHVTDQTGKLVFIPELPQRIISLVPSQTELLAHLQLEQRVIGITKFCIHPNHWFRNKQRIGGTKNPNHSLIERLKPDLILANKEENNPDDIAAFEAFCPVWTSNISTINDALQMIEAIGKVTGTSERASALVQELIQKLDAIPTRKAIKVAYVIWKNPFMVAGGDTFIHAMLSKAGFINVFENSKRYPTISTEQLTDTGADVVFLSSEPYPFKEKDIVELKDNLTQTKQHQKIPDIILVNGEYFSWYGSRLLEATDYLNALIKSVAS